MAKRISDLNMNDLEIQNVCLQNLATSPNGKAGKVYFNTATSQFKGFTDANTEINLGNNYTFDDGLTEDTSTHKVTLDIADGSSIGGVIIGDNVNVTNAGKISVNSASTSQKGVIEIATDAECTIGTDTSRAVTPKQLAGKISKLTTAPTAGTYTKVVINSDGLVTSGGSLLASDIPDLTLSKISDVTASKDELNILDGATVSTAELNILDGVTADKDEINVLDGITASTAELNILDGVTVTASDINSVTSKIGLSSLSIDSGSTNYLGYSNSTGKFSAKVDTTVTANSTKLVTSGAVATAIANEQTGSMKYKGAWDITSATDYSGITLPVKAGYYYRVTGTGPKTIGGIEWNAGDCLIIDEDVASGGTITSVTKIDNTEGSDIVRLNSTQTITNKTIDGDDNTIQDLSTSVFKSGVLQTSVRAESSASNSALATEKAIATAIKNFLTASSTATLTNKTFNANGTGNSITNLETADFASGVIQTSVRAVSSASDTALPTEKAVASAISGKISKIAESNPALTASGGICTWEITNSIGSADVTVCLREVATGEVVYPDWTITDSKVTVEINSTSNITAGTYRAVITG